MKIPIEVVHKAKLDAFLEVKSQIDEMLKDCRESHPETPTKGIFDKDRFLLSVLSFCPGHDGGAYHIATNLLVESRQETDELYKIGAREISNSLLCAIIETHYN